MITLQPDEHILLIARRHPFFLFLEMIPLLPLLILPILFVILGQFVDIGNYLERQTSVMTENAGVTYEPTQWNTEESTPVTSQSERALPVLVVSIWLLLLWIAGFVIWTDYYLDVLVLTNKKIIDIEQKALFSRETTSLPLEKIQDITVNVDGILAAYFQFGNLEIQTAGENTKIIVRFIKNPNEVKKDVMTAYESAMQKTREVKIVG